MAEFKKQYPGKSAAEIYGRVHKVMEGVAQKMDMAYETDANARTGKVSKMGVTGSYVVVDGAVTLDVKFPMLVPGSVKKKVQASIEEKLDKLFA